MQKTATHIHYHYWWINLCSKP